MTILKETFWCLHRAHRLCTMLLLRWETEDLGEHWQAMGGAQSLVPSLLLCPSPKRTEICWCCAEPPQSGHQIHSKKHFQFPWLFHVLSLSKCFPQGRIILVALVGSCQMNVPLSSINTDFLLLTYCTKSWTCLKKGPAGWLVQWKSISKTLHREFLICHKCDKCETLHFSEKTVLQVKIPLKSK